MRVLSSFLTVAFATGAVAAPNALLEDRSVGIVYLEFFPEADCKGGWLENTVWVDRGVDTCYRETTVTWKPYASWKIINNSAIRDVNVFSQPGCTTDGDGSVITVPAGDTQCYNQHIGSTQFLV
ncbi:hypothetical protein HJFPF1_07073 [Paramyrothecium foliicola]|nr:hypothetical protein HJFPF1_07073 [Paramyrothecium foliicola]